MSTVFRSDLEEGVVVATVVAKSLAMDEHRSRGHLSQRIEREAAFRKLHCLSRVEIGGENLLCT